MKVLIKPVLAIFETSKYGCSSALNTSKFPKFGMETKFHVNQCCTFWCSPKTVEHAHINSHSTKFGLSTFAIFKEVTEILNTKYFSVLWLSVKEKKRIS